MAVDNKADEVSIGVTAFKARCLALIEEVSQGKTRRVLLTKRNRPIAAIVPVEHSVPSQCVPAPHPCQAHPGDTGRRTRRPGSWRCNERAPGLLLAAPSPSRIGRSPGRSGSESRPGYGCTSCRDG